MKYDILYLEYWVFIDEELDEEFLVGVSDEKRLYLDSISIIDLLQKIKQLDKIKDAFSIDIAELDTWFESKMDKYFNIIDKECTDQNRTLQWRVDLIAANLELAEDDEKGFNRVKEYGRPNPEQLTLFS